MHSRHFRFQMRNARRPNIFRITHKAFGFHLAWRIEFSQCAIPKIHQTACTHCCVETHSFWIMHGFHSVIHLHTATVRTPRIVSLREKRFNFTDTHRHIHCIFIIRNALIYIYFAFKIIIIKMKMNKKKQKNFTFQSNNNKNVWCAIKSEQFT